MSGAGMLLLPCCAAADLRHPVRIIVEDLPPVRVTIALEHLQRAIPHELLLRLLADSVEHARQRVATNPCIEAELNQLGTRAPTATAIASGHRAQHLEAPRDRGREALLAADVSHEKYVMRRADLVATVGVRPNCWSILSADQASST